MNALHEVLEPHKELIGAFAGIVTIGQIFSGIPVCYDIKKSGSTEGFSIIPFLGGTVFGLLNLQYGFILKDDTMIRVNFFGLFLNIIYLTFFYIYTKGKDKTTVWGQMGIGGALTLALIGYAQQEDPAKIEFRFGMILTVFLFYLVISPLFGLKEIIKNKSTKGLPFPIIASGTVVSFAWMLYSIAINNTVMIWQNIVVVAISVFQLSLFVIYPSTGVDKPKSGKKPAKKEN